jgi:uncharacterized protein YfkK (UPF0435 family)
MPLTLKVTPILEKLNMINVAYIGESKNYFEKKIIN